MLKSKGSLHEVPRGPRDLKWSAFEKKVARRAYEAALERALAEIMAEFKTRAAAASTPSDMWAIEDYLRLRRREIDETFDFRYANLPFVFARLIREGWLDEAWLGDLSEENQEVIRRLSSFMGSG